MKSVCERCGKPANVHITGERYNGENMRHLCVSCTISEREISSSKGRSLNYGAILLSVGLFVLVISSFADILRFGSGEGFGLKQFTGLTIAGLLVLIGAVTKISTVLVIGLIGCILTVLADWLGFGSADGFGWQQLSGLILGAGLIGLGLRVARRINGSRFCYKSPVRMQQAS